MDRSLFHKSHGSALAQYAIILALVAAVLVPGFFFLGNNIVDSFKNFYVCLGGDPSLIGNPSASSSSESGSLINTDGELFTSTPGSDCEGNDCVLDFGPIVLDGVPNDLAEIIETSGTHGGTEAIAGLLTQIAEQVSDLENVSEEDKSKIDQLATLAYELASYEATIENFSSEALALYEQSMANFDQSYYSSLPTSEEKATYINTIFGELENSYLTDIEGETFITNFLNIASSTTFDSSSLFASSSEGYDFSTSTRTQFDTLLSELTGSESNLDGDLKNILNVLGTDVQVLADNMSSTLNVYEDSILLSGSNETAISTIQSNLEDGYQQIFTSESEMQNIISDPAYAQTVITNLMNTIDTSTLTQYDSEYLEKQNDLISYQLLTQIVSGYLDNSATLTPTQQESAQVLYTQLGILGEQNIGVDYLPEVEFVFTTAAALFDVVGQANDGLTSDQTNIDGKLIDISSDGEVDAEPEEVSGVSGDEDQLLLPQEEQPEEVSGTTGE